MLPSSGPNLPSFPPLTRDNYPAWKKDVAKHSIVYGDAAAAIMRNVRFTLNPPSFADTYPAIGDDRPQLKYPTTGNPATLTADSIRFFRDDQAIFKKELAVFNKDNDSLLHFLLTSISPAPETTLHTRPGFAIAVNNKDSFKVWEFITATHFKGSSRSTFRQLGHFLHLKQNSDPFEHFIEQLREMEQQVLANYGSIDHPGFIRISHLTAGIFLQGVQQDRFEFKIESTLSTYQDGKIDDIWPIVDSFQQYNLEKEQPNPLPTGLEKGFVSQISTHFICVDCKKSFPQRSGLNPKTHLPYTYTHCSPCHSSSNSNRRSLSRSLIAAETPVVSTVPPPALLPPSCHICALSSTCAISIYICWYPSG